MGGQQVATLSELTSGDSREPLSASRVNWNLFHLLGVSPVLGRDFRASDDVPGAEPVAILSHDLWTRRFGRDATVYRYIRSPMEWVSDMTALPDTGASGPGRPVRFGELMMCTWSSPVTAQSRRRTGTLRPIVK